MYTQVEAISLPLGIYKAMRELDKGLIVTRENQDRVDECKEIRLCLTVLKPQTEPKYSRAIPCGKKDLISYIDEFINGTADDLGWKYTYHQLYAPYYDKAIEELSRNIHTRRCCIALGQGDINFTQDPPCLQLLMFDIPFDKLEITAVFRSNDGVKAFGMNIQAIAELQKKVAEEMGVGVGSLNYIANNFHAYSKDWDLLRQYLSLMEKKALSKWSWRSDD